MTRQKKGLKINFNLQAKHNKGLHLKEKKMAEQAKQENRPPIESGCPDAIQYMHPVMRKNYGQWAYHEDPRPGVLKHVAHSGDAIWTVRAGTQRILDVTTLNILCDIGDKFADGYVRFTIRSNIEYMIDQESKVGP